MTMQNRFI